MSVMLSPQDLPGRFLEISAAKAAMPWPRILLLGIIAGAYISMGAFLVIVVSKDLPPWFGAGLTSLLSGAVFPVGLILIVLGGGELFTGNCLMTIGWLEKKLSLKQIIANWGLVYGANFCRALLLAFWRWGGGLLQGAAALRAMEIAAAKAGLGGGEIFFRAILCNWMVALAVWLAAAALSVPGKVIAVWIPVMAFVTGSFEHCIANMYFFSAAYLAKTDQAAAALLSPEKLEHLNLSAFAANLAPATLGNIAGAFCLVVMIYYLAYRKN
jgi:formate/nitrite transporter